MSIWSYFREVVPVLMGFSDTLQAPQSLVLPRRSLSLNVLDGYDTLKLALRHIVLGPLTTMSW